MSRCSGASRQAFYGLPHCWQRCFRFRACLSRTTPMQLRATGAFSSTTECNGRWKGSGVLVDDRLAPGPIGTVVGDAILFADDVHTDISDDAVNRYASVGVDWFDWSQFDARTTWRWRSYRAARTSSLCTGADFWYWGG